MKHTMTLIRHAAIALCAALLLFGTSAYAMTLQEAKAAGLLGEQADGYIGVVSANADANQIAASVNAQRRTGYQEIAKRNGTSLDTVEALGGQAAINKTPGGQYVNTGSGWQMK
jgi:uncharacterized protein YdbL (DUF1318 family)